MKNYTTGNDESVTMMRKMNPDWAKNQANKTTYSSLTQINEKIPAYLCDTAQWTKYVDTKKADWAIASPSVEMYVDSYNSVKHAEGYGKLGAKYRETDSPGYIYTINGEKSYEDYETDYITIENKTYNNMYTGLSSENLSDLMGFVMCSPSAKSKNYICTFYIGWSNLSTMYRGDWDYAITPIVSLKSGTKLSISNN